MSIYFEQVRRRRRRCCRRPPPRRRSKFLNLKFSRSSVPTRTTRTKASASQSCNWLSRLFPPSKSPMQRKLFIEQSGWTTSPSCGVEKVHATTLSRAHKIHLQGTLHLLDKSFSKSCDGVWLHEYNLPNIVSIEWMGGVYGDAGQHVRYCCDASEWVICGWSNTI